MQKSAGPQQPAPGTAPAPGAAQPAPTTAPPPLNTWMDAARKANPGVSDADLANYYNSKYGR